MLTNVLRGREGDLKEAISKLDKKKEFDKKREVHFNAWAGSESGGRGG